MNEESRENKMRKDTLILGIIISTVVVVASLASCIVGYVLFPFMDRPVPTPSPYAPVPTLQDIQRAAELATVKYSLITEIGDENVPDDLRKEFGIKEEILLIAYGEAAAGFDLSKVSEEDMWVDGTRVQLHLPPPEILYVRLDNDRTHVVHYEKSWLMDHDLNLESRARQQAEDAIRTAALESDILERANEYGELFFSNWLYSMGFTEVQVIVG
jgi:hypothetical protein